MYTTHCRGLYVRRGLRFVRGLRGAPVPFLVGVGVCMYGGVCGSCGVCGAHQSLSLSVFRGFVRGLRCRPVPFLVGSCGVCGAGIMPKGTQKHPERALESCLKAHRSALKGRWNHAGGIDGPEGSNPTPWPVDNSVDNSGISQDVCAQELRNWV